MSPVILATAILLSAAALAVAPKAKPPAQQFPKSWQLAFVRDGNIWVMPGSGGKEERLTQDGKSVFPLWSPDGRRILFLKAVFVNESAEVSRESMMQTTGCHLWVMDADGKNARRLFGDADAFAFPWQSYEYLGSRDYRQSNWSPNGEWIACASTNRESLKTEHHDSPCLSDLWVVKSDGSAKKRLAAGEPTYRGYLTSYLWSPDSRRLVYWNALRHWGLFTLIDLNGRARAFRTPQISRSASLGLHDPCLAWARNGKHILVGRNSIWGDSGPFVSELYRLSLDGHASRLPINPYWFSAFSHKVDRVAYDMHRRIKGKNSKILYVSRLDGSRRIRMSARPEDGTDTQVLWSPDDAWIAHCVPFGESVTTVRPSGSARHAHSFRIPHAWRIVRAQWAPDSRHLIVHAAPTRNDEDESDAGDIYVADAVDGTWTQLTKGAACQDVDVGSIPGTHGSITRAGR